MSRQRQWDRDEIDWADIPAEFLSDTGSNGFHVYEYNGDKLRQVVDQAVTDAEAAGMHKNAKAVLKVYEYSLLNSHARLLLDKVLARRDTPLEYSRFQGYVKVATQKSRRKTSKGKESKGDKDGHSAEFSSSRSQPPTADRGTGGEPETRNKLKRKRNESVESAILYCPRDCKCPSCNSEIKRQDAEDRNTDRNEQMKIPRLDEAQKEEAEGDLNVEMQVVDDILNLVDEVDMPQQSSVRVPHPDPLVTRILGDLQYEPSARELLKPFEKQLPDTKLSESTLQLIKKLFTLYPKSKTDMDEFTEHVEEMESSSKIPDDDISTQGSLEDSLEQRDEGQGTYEEGEVRSDDRPFRASKRSAIKKKRRVRVAGQFPCPVADETGCEKVFSRTCHAKRHNTVCHLREGKDECPFCEETFPRRDYLEAHGKRFHAKLWGKQ